MGCGTEPCGEGFARADNGNCYPIVQQPGEADADTDADCEISAQPAYPLDGQQDAYHRAAVEFGLSAPDPDATISLRDASGVPLSGTVSNQDTLVVFAPDEPLQPASSYRATLDWCAGQATIGFQTSELGLPLTVDLVDRTFELDLFSGRNDSIFELLHSVFEVSPLLSVTATHTATLDMRASLIDEDLSAQDVCQPTGELDAQPFETPFFTLQKDSVDLMMSGLLFSLEQFEFEGTFSSDGASIGGGSLSFVIDARHVPGGAARHDRAGQVLLADRQLWDPL